MSTAIMEKPVGWLVAEGLECGEQGLYHLPKDHAWHSGPTYFCNDFFEWHYFTFLGKDEKKPAMTSRSSGVRCRKDF